MTAATAAKPATFLFVLLPRFNMAALMATIEPLRIANYLTGGALYDWAFVAPSGGHVTASNGLSVDAEDLPAKVDPEAAVFVCASWNAEHYENRLDVAGFFFPDD